MFCNFKFKRYNRLGGNALTECVVFGRAAGQAIELNRQKIEHNNNINNNDNNDNESTKTKLKSFTRKQLLEHNNENDCYVEL